MSWQEWLGSLLMLLGIGGIVILLAEALCCLLRLDRKRPEPEEVEEPVESDYMQNRVRQLRAMAKHRAATTDPLADADADAYFAQVDAEVTAEAARIAKREVRR